MGSLFNRRVRNERLLTERHPSAVRSSAAQLEPLAHPRELKRHITKRQMMGRYLLLWLIGVPVPILLLIWLLGGLH